MASIFGHALAAGSLGSLFPRPINLTKCIMLGIFCAVFPDADVIAFQFGIPYESMWGHRGITHSAFFSILWGALIATIFYRDSPVFSKQWNMLGVYFSICTLSHGLLDAMTSGGLGVAFFAPFENSRYFFPWRPIQVSPIGAHKFFSEWGLRVIKSELVWIGIPSLIIFATAFIRSRINRAAK